MPGVHRDRFASSLFRFVRDETQQLAPTRSQDLTIQARLRGGPIGVMTSLFIRARRRTPHQVRDLEILIDDQPVRIDEYDTHPHEELGVPTNTPTTPRQSRRTRSFRPAILPARR